MDFVFYLLNCYEKGIKPGQDQQDTDHLPMLTYSLKRTTVVGFPSITEIMENLSWDYTEKELYKDNPTKYNIEILISANWKKAPTGIGNIRDVSNMQFNDKAKHYISSAVPIVENSYKWRYSQQGKELYKCGNWQSENRSSRKCRNMHWNYSRYGYERYRTRIVPWSVRRACCGAGFRGFQRQEKRTAEIREIANFAFV